MHKYFFSEKLNYYPDLSGSIHMKLSAIGVLIIVMIFCAVNHAFAEKSARRQLTPQERRGKQIYLFGTSASGREITALMGGGSTEVPASALTCVNCHGYDGKGRPEGGVLPSDITEAALRKPYGVTHPNGRTHPPYTDRFLRRAITQGIDPAGNALSPTMPVYRLTQEEVNDLITYLRRLGKERDPGLMDDRIQVGIILPGKESPTEAGQVMKAVLLSYFKDLNEQGGIYNRRIELRFALSGDTPATTLAGMMHLIGKEGVFVINGANIGGAEKEIEALIREQETPLVGAVTNFPRVDFPLNRYIFYLYSGVSEQACAMVDYAANELDKENPHIAILSPESEIFLGVMNAIGEQCRKNGWNSVTTLTYSRGRFNAALLAKELKQKEIEVLFFLGSGEEQRTLLNEGGQIQWSPFVFIPGTLTGKEILDVSPSFKGRIFLSFPREPFDMTRDTVTEYRIFAERHKIPARYLSVQVDAYCSAKILVEGLKRAGKDVSREKLVTVLEGLYEYETGLTPQITFGPNRRIGALGAYIALVDPEEKKIIGVSEWVKNQ